MPRGPAVTLYTRSGMEWISIFPEALGFIPEFLNPNDPRPAREQLDEAYVHGGGWRPFNGFTLKDNNNLSYPGDPETLPLGETWLRNEHIIVYEHSWVAIIQEDRSFEVSRMD